MPVWKASTFIDKICRTGSCGSKGANNDSSFACPFFGLGFAAIPDLSVSIYVVGQVERDLLGYPAIMDFVRSNDQHALDRVLSEKDARVVDRDFGFSCATVHQVAEERPVPASLESFALK